MRKGLLLEVGDRQAFPDDVVDYQLFLLEIRRTDGIQRLIERLDTSTTLTQGGLLISYLNPQNPFAEHTTPALLYKASLA